MKNLKDYQIVAFDLDGTLTESRQIISSSMSDLLVLLAKQVTVVIISGSSFKNMLKQLGTFLSNANSQVFDSVILMPTNGSLTFTYNDLNGTWELSNSVPISNTQKSQTIDAIKEVISSGLFDIPSYPIGDQIQDRQGQISFSALGVDAPIEQKKLWDPDESKRQRIVEYITPKLPNSAIFIAGTTTIDILPKGVTKGRDLLNMLQQHGIDKDKMLFVGDAVYTGGNDSSVADEGIETIKTAGPQETAKIIENLLN